MRILSLLPSATETVCALGRESDLVGRSEECDYPTSVRALPVVMRARTWDSERASREIDDRVRLMRSTGSSLYELDLPKLRTLRPDLILTQDLCGVCSVTDAEVREACSRSGVTPQILSLAPRRLSQVWEDLESIGVAVGEAARGRSLATDCRDRTKRVARSRAAGARVAVVEWLDPPILAGLWSPDLVSASGSEPVGPSPGEPGRRTTWEQIEEENPELLILSPCSFSVGRTRRELTRTELLGRVSRLDPHLGIWLADEAYFSRPGPRLADGAELVSSLVESRPPSGPMPVERWAPEVAAPP